ncbi:MAG: xanthine dehydrogenase family protein subunit M [Chloroflexota bacterium]|nr:MAG: xanthine dehydrogenase family protein subunit M [Chloroflexota bacterium]
MGSYLRPATLAEAIEALARAADDGRPGVIVAGATDHYPARVGRVTDDDVIDVTGIAGLRAIEPADGGWRIPALATWTDVATADLPPLFDGLRRAARTIGGRQIQNRATVVGNLVNASPAADGTPNLLALDAEVVLASVRGERRVPVAAFVTGNRTTVRAADEIVTGLFIPALDSSVRSTFLKLGSRAYLVISIAMVAAVVAVDATRRVTHARVAVGACSPVARRLWDLEAALVGQPAAPGVGATVRPEHLAGLSPIDDVRGTGTYRLEGAEALVRRALEELAA